MRTLAAAVLVLALTACGEPTTFSFADGAASFARGDNPRAPLAVYTTQLRADNERPHTSTSEAWGFAQVKVKPGGVIEWTVRVHNPEQESFFAGHIHVISNPDGTGPVVQTLFASTITDEKFELRGSATNQAVATALLDHPGNYYINLHTTAIPAGAIRGDLP